MYGVYQMYFDSGKVSARVMNTVETAKFIADSGTFQKDSATQYYRRGGCMDVYVDLFRTRREAVLFCQDALNA